ncbi:MAG: response regulator transcription factor [Candidatus Eremiobacteraeota bacterium]|nr:response regulator transcription factor [Candidatus Eremiobacteraeota bacterium]
MPQRVLIVEDDEKTAQIVRSYLVREGYAVEIVADGLSALRAAQRELPALVLLDVMLPELDGMEVCRSLRRLGDVAIIMLTARTTEADKIEGLGAGADDYVAKPFSPRELVARIKSVLRRSGSDVQAVFGDLEIGRSARRVRVRGAVLALTPTEYRVIDALAASAGTVLTRADLVERALGFEYDGADRTIDVHVRNIRKKIEAAGGRPQVIRTVFGSGYALDADA